jgi:hypothetical protein
VSTSLRPAIARVLAVPMGGSYAGEERRPRQVGTRSNAAMRGAHTAPANSPAAFRQSISDPVSAQ